MVELSESPALPKLRSDLILSHQEHEGAPLLVVKDPASGRFFRFREVEGFILQQLSVSASPQKVREDVEQQFEVALSQQALEQFLARLRRLGLLGEKTAQDALEDNKRLRGSPLYLRLKAINPDKLLRWMVGRCGFFFTKSFVVISLGAMAAALCITLANRNEIRLDLPRLYSVQSLLLAWVIGLLVVTFHEFAHGLTCKFYGGSVKEMGFLLIFFQPAFYCNVSDAWLFKEKANRLKVTLAGAYFEMFLWALATVLWWFTDPHSLPHYIALVVVATSAVKTFFNLNPLIKLDGYYLLSDYLDVPNLRQRAFAYLGQCWRKLWGISGAQAVTPTPRERRIYVLYGVLAWVYSIWLLLFVLYHFGGFLVRKYQAWGFALTITCLLIMFNHPLKSLFRRAEPVEASQASRPAVNRWARRGFRLTLLGFIVFLLWFFHWELKVSGTFKIVSARQADVRPEVDGIIQEVLVEEGALVKQGQPIATLSGRDYSSELAKTKAMIEEKQARFKLLQAGARPEEIALLKTADSKAESRLKHARILLDMDSTLATEKLISIREYADTKELVTVREKELQEVKDKLKLLEAGSRKEEMEEVMAEIGRLRAQHQYLEEQLKLLKVFSPISGVVTTYKPREMVGRLVRKGELLMEVKDLSRVTADIIVPEKEFADVKLGQKVLLKAQAYPQLSFSGEVKWIAPVATAPEDVREERTIRVITELDNSNGLLKPEMTGNAKIFCGEQSILSLIGRRLVRYVRVEFWSWW